MLGMNDVLPKPFTKEGLLNMLEKHLGHLKKPDYDMIPQTAATLAQNSTGASAKDESSPGQSPSTMSNWHSPGQFTGISPSQSNFMPGGQYPMDQGGMQYTSPTSQMPPGRGANRRVVGDMTGPVDEISGDPKRPRIYATTNNAMNQMRRV